jgi:hypothetical protein
MRYFIGRDPRASFRSKAASLGPKVAPTGDAKLAE